MSLIHIKCHLNDFFGQLFNTFLVNIGFRERIKPPNDIQLNGKTAIITGGNRGIGKAVATDLASRGCKVIIACRDVVTGEVTASEIRSKIPTAKVQVMKVDLSSFTSVREFAKLINSSEPYLDILVNNAGLSSTERIQTEDGMELMMQVNCFSPILLSCLLVDKLSLTRGRIVNVSAVAHHLTQVLNLQDLNWRESDTFPYFKVYGHSKLALMLLTRILGRKFASKHVAVYASDPGIALTDFQSGMSKLHRFFVTSIFGKMFTRSTDEAGDSIVSAVIDPSNQYHGGNKYYIQDFEFKNPSPGAQDDEVAEALWITFRSITKVEIF